MQLKDAGPQAVTYQQVARLFILSPAPKLETSLRKHSAELEQEATKLEGLKDQLVSRLKGVDAQAAELRKSVSGALCLSPLVLCLSS
uniref:Mediator complex subunit MED11 n=1 Tax=Toxoplasma gondii COUG TaxID=1074873 RepID=A0A2G8XSS9_TOXGO|nr:mediator complex subunit MED11 [Toxoplasma gondii COUG]